MEFTEDAVARARRRTARERGVLFISSPFSIEAVDLLERIGQPLWKIASGEVSNTSAARSRARDRRAGAAVDRHEPAGRDRRGGGARQGARRAGRRAAVHDRVSVPAGAGRPEPDAVLSRALRLLGRAVGSLRRRSIPGLAGAALGMDVLEVHVALSREMFGPDVVASVTTAELRQLVDGVRFIERMRAQSGRQGRRRPRTPRRCGGCSRAASSRGARCRRHRARTATICAIKKPGTGLPPERLDEIVGRRLAAAVAADQLLTADDIEGLVATAVARSP